MTSASPWRRAFTWLLMTDPVLDVRPGDVRLETLAADEIEIPNQPAAGLGNRCDLLHHIGTYHTLV
ncbi:MAG: hypothetical protein AB1486_29595 [Planctomycetota bacterium]